jgi:hypothetical protein
MTPDIIAQGIFLFFFRIILWGGGAVLLLYLISEALSNHGCKKANRDYAKWYAAQPPKPTPSPKEEREMRKFEARMSRITGETGR